MEFPCTLHRVNGESGAKRGIFMSKNREKINSPFLKILHKYMNIKHKQME